MTTTGGAANAATVVSEAIKAILFFISITLSVISRRRTPAAYSMQKYSAGKIFFQALETKNRKITGVQRRRKPRPGLPPCPREEPERRPRTGLSGSCGCSANGGSTSISSSGSVLWNCTLSSSSIAGR